MANGRFIESLEDRRFLSAGHVCTGESPEISQAAVLASVSPQRAFNVNLLLGDYSGTVKLTKPTGLRPYKFNVTITSINVTSKLVTGTISLPKLHFSGIAFTSKSTYTASTKQFILRIVSTGTPAPMTLSITLKGNITSANIAARQLTGRFSGFVPFNNQPRVAVDGSFTVTKA